MDNTTGQINVHDFGAKGDGITDDTAAINTAFDAMRKASILTDQERPTDQGGAAHLRGTCPEVFFPNGLYLISDEINISGVFNGLRDRDMGPQAIRGDHAIIKQTGGREKDIFVGRYSALTNVTGFKFINGRNQLWLDNPNIGGFLKVTDCEFHGADGTAVIFGHHCNSTSVLLAQCLIRDCEQWVYTMADVAMLRDINGGGCHSRTGNNAAFDLRGGFVTLDNVMSTPWSEGHDQRWIDNRACLLELSRSRFGGEDGGILTVLNFVKYSTDLACANAIIIDNCCLYNQSNLKRQAVIYCEEIPNRIIVKNSTVCGIPAIMVDKKIDLANYFEGVEPGALDFAVEHCSGCRGDIPELLKHPVIKEKKVEFLSNEEIKTRVDRAARYVRDFSKNHKPPAPAVYDGHCEQTDPAKYMDISFGKYRWTLEGFADAETVPNSKYHVVVPVDDDILVMKTTQGSGNAWVLIKDVSIDLDRHPYLTYRVKSTEFGVNVNFALRVIDKESGEASLWNGGWGVDAPLYYAYDLRKFHGAGKKTFDIRVYAPGCRFGTKRPDDVLDGKTLSSTGACVGDLVLISTDAGEYTVIDFMRAEAE